MRVNVETYNESNTDMVRIGATRSREAISTPISDRNTVSKRAKLGSPFRPERLKKLRKERRLSLAMACISRGAPVRDCSAAPRVENRAPIKMTQRVGHAKRATVSPAASPNWSTSKNRRTVPPKNNTQVRSRGSTGSEEDHECIMVLQMVEVVEMAARVPMGIDF